ncbi:YybS family protein [Clostridium cadaveris]|uniref:YybS family protein n=1 Tax=Clostridium cadaveris TaxID=1529 RepID=UPI000C086C39|nr:YybS family protein [Clostridium cadaveris]
MKNKNYNTKAVVEAGLMCALVVVIFLMNMYLPIFGFIGLFILPIPITILYLRHDFKIALTSVAVSAILISMMSSVVSAVSSSVLYGGSALAVGYCIKNHKGVTRTLIYSSIAMLIGTVVNFALMIYVTYNSSLSAIIQEYIDMMKESMDMVSGLYQSIGVDMANNPMMESLNKITPDVLMMMVPAILIISSLIQAYINYGITRKILNRFNYDVPKFRPFNQWYIDNRIGAGVLIALMLANIIHNYIPGSAYVVFTLAYILQTMCMILGISVVYNWFVKRGSSNKLILTMLILFAFTNPLLTRIAYFIGLADLIVDFRKLDPNSLSIAIQEWIKNRKRKK